MLGGRSRYGSNVDRSLSMSALDGSAPSIESASLLQFRASLASQPSDPSTARRELLHAQKELDRTLRDLRTVMHERDQLQADLLSARQHSDTLAGALRRRGGVPASQDAYATIAMLEAERDEYAEEAASLSAEIEALRAAVSVAEERARDAERRGRAAATEASVAAQKVRDSTVSELEQRLKETESVLTELITANETLEADLDHAEQRARAAAAAAETANRKATGAEAEVLAMRRARVDLESRLARSDEQLRAIGGEEAVLARATISAERDAARSECARLQQLLAESEESRRRESLAASAATDKLALVERRAHEAETQVQTANEALARAESVIRDTAAAMEAAERRANDIHALLQAANERAAAAEAAAAAAAATAAAAADTTECDQLRAELSSLRQQLSVTEESRAATERDLRRRLAQAEAGARELAGVREMELQREVRETAEREKEATELVRLLEQRLDASEAEILQLRGQLQAMPSVDSAQLTTLQQRAETAERRVNELESRVDALRTELDDADGHADDLSQQLQAVTADRDHVMAELADALSAVAHHSAAAASAIPDATLASYKEKYLVLLDEHEAVQTQLLAAQSDGAKLRDALDRTSRTDNNSLEQLRSENQMLKVELEKAKRRATEATETAEEATLLVQALMEAQGQGAEFSPAPPPQEHNEELGFTLRERELMNRFSDANFVDPLASSQVQPQLTVADVQEDLLLED